MSDRDAILIRCLKEEAEQIRERAMRDRRYVSSYVLSIVMRFVEFEERLFLKLLRFDELNRVARRPVRIAGPKTTMMIRCSKEDAKRIRTTAQRRQMSVSAFIRQCLRRNWNLEEYRNAGSGARRVALIERGSQITEEIRRLTSENERRLKLIREKLNST